MIFDKTGGLEAVTEFNKSRSNLATAEEAFDKASNSRWHALVRMARAHKKMCDISGEDDVFCHWLDSLYGKRDEILRLADRAKSE